MQPRTLRNLLFCGPPFTIAIVVAIWVTTLLAIDKEKSRNARQQACLQATAWRATLESQLWYAVTSSYIAAGFIAGSATEIPMHNSTYAARRHHTIRSDIFETFVQDLMQVSPGLYSVQIQPSAIVTQAYPHGTAKIGNDLLNNSARRQDVLNAIARAGPVISGPYMLFQGFVGFLVRHPVFLKIPRTFDTWWGNAAVVVKLEQFINDTQLSQLSSQGYHYLLEYVNQNTGCMETISNSTLEFDRTTAAHAAVRLPNNFTWDLYIKPKETGQIVWSVEYIGFITGLSLACGLTCAIAIASLYWFQVHTRDDISAAPTSPPLTIMFTDIEGSTSFWASHPRVMTAALALHNSIIQEQLGKAGAYEVKTIGDSFMIACKSTGAALDLACNILASIHKCTQWPSEVHEFYGVPWMKVRIGLHYCTEVQCRFDEVTRGYDYFGKDVNKAARVVSEAHGDEIVLSDELAQQVASLGKFVFQSLGQRTLRGMAGPHLLHRLVPPHNFPVPVLERPASLYSASVSRSDLQQQHRAQALVQTMAGLSDKDINEEQLLQWVQIMGQVLQLALEPLPEAQRLESIKLLCSAWGSGTTSQSLEHLSLRLCPLLQLQYPALFVSPISPSANTFVGGDQADHWAVSSLS